MQDEVKVTRQTDDQITPPGAAAGPSRRLTKTPVSKDKATFVTKSPLTGRTDIEARKSLLLLFSSP
jgi:hypothetical protein